MNSRKEEEEEEEEVLEDELTLHVAGVELGLSGEAGVADDGPGDEHRGERLLPVAGDPGELLAAEVLQGHG